MGKLKNSGHSIGSWILCQMQDVHWLKVCLQPSCVCKHNKTVLYFQLLSVDKCIMYIFELSSNWCFQLKLFGLIYCLSYSIMMFLMNLDITGLFHFVDLLLQPLQRVKLLHLFEFDSRWWSMADTLHFHWISVYNTNLTKNNVCDRTRNFLQEQTAVTSVNVTSVARPTRGCLSSFATADETPGFLPLRHLSIKWSDAIL